MKTITKNTKRVLSLFIALALLLGSMIILGGNAGVNITANAETGKKTVTWNGTWTIPTKGDGSSDNPYIIESAEHLAHVIRAYSGGAYTNGKYFKVADDIAAFNMNGLQGVDFNSDLSTVSNASPNTDTDFNWTRLGGTSFQGHFDGNGAVVYNIYGAGGQNNANSMGLFLMVDYGATIKNVTVKNSKFVNGGSNLGVGGIFGRHNNASDALVTVENCAVINCDITNTGDNRLGLIGGGQNYRPVEIKNCYTQNNKLTGKDGGVYGGFLSSRAGSATLTVSNCVAIGNSPYPNGTGYGTFDNVYTDVENASYNGDGIVKLGDTHKGALSGTGLSSTYWLAVENDYPQLKGIHQLSVSNNGNTHSAVCSVCDQAGLPEDHYFDVHNAVNGVASCTCGATISNVPAIWNGNAADSYAGGTGTKDDPYIIKTAEQLYKMVQSQGYTCNDSVTVNGSITELYFKVADGVDTLYLNDTINYNTKDKFAGAIGTMTNWSKDLKKDSDRCTLGTSCPAYAAETASGTKNLHTAGFNYTFSGHFDGNGVTIKGLYSETSGGAVWAPGVGFFPGMSDNASIENVTFDTAYIKTTQGFAGVVTSSFGAHGKAAYHSNETVRCADVPLRCPDGSGAKPTLMNIAVRNAYVGTANDGWATANGYAAGLVSTKNPASNIKFNNCLFDGNTSELVSSAGTKFYAGMLCSSNAFEKATEVVNCVTVSNSNMDAIYCAIGTHEGATPPTVKNSYAKGTGTSTFGTIYTSDVKTITGMPMLNWAAWDNSEATVNAFGTVMPKAGNSSFVFKEYKYYRNNFKNTETYNGNPMGSYSDGNSDAGMFFKFNTLKGSGTEADPYLISDADTLFQVVAAGGMHRGNPQHFKLTNDIDIGGTQWVKYQSEAEDDIRNKDGNASERIVYYDYRNFGGVLDGDGYAVTGLYSASADATAGFIPTLDGGTVKNLHFIGGYVYSSASGAKTGIIAGEVKNGGKIENCSIADSVTEVIDGSGAAATSCINFTTNPVPFTADLMSNEANQELYYGIIDSQNPQNAQLVSRGKKLPCVDIDADGKGDEYTSADLTALRNMLLRDANYKYIMGDASRNGSTDIRDLAFVKRMIAHDKFGAADGFWNAVKGGSIAIYFSDNDDYDAARKMELFLESQAPGVDVVKYGVGTTMVGVTTAAAVPTANAIVIKSNDASADWSIKYNSANAVLNINGKNFTAAYEAVEYFAANSNASTGAFVKDYTGTQDTNKAPITVNGQTYYYAWADEFNTAVNGSINYDTWLIRDKGGDKEIRDTYGRENESYAFYDNLKLGSDEMLPMLNEVKDGKLVMHRGVQGYTAWENAFGNNNLASYASNTQTDDGDKVMFDSNDMASGGVLQTKNSFLYNKGYVEFKAKLPNDKYSFPALWLYTTPGYNNRDIANSMYGKVLPLNSRYDNNSINFSADNVESYKYEVPTYFFELDVVEILNQGKVRKQTNTTIHKWYNNARVAGTATNAFSIYDLNWDNVRNNENQFSTIATYSGSGNISGGLSLSSGSKTSTSAFSSSTYEGGANWYYQNSSYVGELAQTKELIFGYLWENDVMKVYILDGSTRTQLQMWTLDSTGGLTKGGKTYKTYDSYNGYAAGDDQYTHILIDNHMFPYDSGDIDLGIFGTISGDFTSEEVKNDGILEIDYVRVYQLNDAKNIVTSDTEAFNSNNRLGK